MKAMILAAGEGKRMRPLTDTTPKPLLPIQGKAIIEHHMDHLVAAHFEELVINVSYLGEQIVHHVEALIQPSLTVHFSREPDLLETGGGIFNALPLLGSEPFVLVNGDTWTDYPLQNLKLPEGMLAHLVLVDNPPEHLSGDFAFSTDSHPELQSSSLPPNQPPKPLSKIQPKLPPKLHSKLPPKLQGVLKEQGDVQYTYSGIAVLHPKLFAGCEPGRYALPPLLRNAMRAGEVTGELYQGRWFDIGTPQRLHEINALLAETDEF